MDGRRVSSGAGHENAFPVHRGTKPGECSRFMVYLFFMF